MLEILHIYFGNFVRTLVFITFLVCSFSLKFKKKEHTILFLILLVCFCAEALNAIFKFYGKSTAAGSNITTILYYGLWLMLIGYEVQFKKIYSFILCLFFIVALLNITLFEGINEFDFSTYIIGAFVYISTFIYESFRQLKRENFNYFLSNRFLLYSAPVPLMLGLSFYFGFKDISLGEYIVFSRFKFYDFICYSVNFISYALLNIYVYREVRKNETP
ncbi:hypothetical protein FMM05_06030 [Flavobacterium zepuense]|uniref:YhhN-like protein n=1 Tax=Flavobacterium zepuense TaxID=2593302 RepID=A0A552V5P5_9FLAO|nr:hypothetical protein [Flavobacterium zepuense]TRW25779.1 hypothetical protein FMM05_06030 [Flavobacterium zepuense]